jgi:uroporphyrinogen decarboxylase
MSMTHRARAILALEGKQPDFVPTFELAFQLTEEAFGKSFRVGPEYESLPEEERCKLCDENAELYLQIAERYEHSIIMLTHTPSTVFPQKHFEMAYTARRIHELARTKGEDYLVVTHGDATFAIPEGENLEQMIETLAEDPDSLKPQAEKMLYTRSGTCLYYAQNGFDGFALCSDYAFNANPFFSPPQFAEYVAPYLKRLVAAYRQAGMYVIKHTDGNINPILDQMVDAHPHAVHSIDPQGGMDIAAVKKAYGARVALCGNVNCGLMQTGTEAEVLESCEYAMRHGKPGGGYVFCTSNCAFKGLPLERYELMIDYWRKHRAY